MDKKKYLSVVKWNKKAKGKLPFEKRVHKLHQNKAFDNKIQLHGFKLKKMGILFLTFETTFDEKRKVKGDEKMKYLKKTN